MSAPVASPPKLHSVLVELRESGVYYLSCTCGWHTMLIPYDPFPGGGDVDRQNAMQVARQCQWHFRGKK